MCVCVYVCVWVLSVYGVIYVLGIRAYVCVLGVYVWCMCAGLCGVCMCVGGTCMSTYVYVCYVGACEERKKEQYYLGQDMPTYTVQWRKNIYFSSITLSWKGIGGKNQHNKSYQ